jgi:glycerol uptake facilitator-like aquaporin
VLLAAIIGSNIMGARLSAGNDALAHLGSTLPTGAILVVLITMFWSISGSHFNPVVTGVFWMRGDINSRLSVAYISAQLMGAFVGLLAAHLMFDLPLLQLSAKVRTGSGQWFAEWVATFGLIVTILATLKANVATVPMSVGLYITAASWFTASTSFANPAVTIARAFSDTFAGIRLDDVTPFIAAQILGALCALLACNWLLEDRSGKSVSANVSVQAEPKMQRLCELAAALSRATPVWH